MKRKVLFALAVVAFAIATTNAQQIYSSLGSGTFVEGISPVVNTITVNEPNGTVSVDFHATDASYTNTYGSYTDNDGGDGFGWDVDMGQLPPEAVVIWAEFFDGSNNSLGYSDDLQISVLPKPEWLINGSVANVSVSGTVISFQGIYPIYSLPYTIPSSVKGIGGRSLDIVGNFIFNATFEITSSTASVSDNKVQIGINVLDQLPSFTEDIDFTSTCTLGSDLNLSFVISDEINSDPISLNVPKMKFPVAAGLTVSVDAGISLYATLRGQIVIGQQSGQWGFIDNGSATTEIIGVLTGQGFIRGEISVLAGAASANASLKAKARLGAGFSYVSVPSSYLDTLFGGDISIWGEVCYKTFWGFGPSGCKESESFYYGRFGDTAAIGKNSIDFFDATFNTRSITYRDTGTLVLPDFNPQPTFSTNGDKLYAVWLEHDNNTGYLLFSKLNQAGTEFSKEIVAMENLNSISNPKVGVLPSGSAIITWSQSRYNISTLPVNYDDEDLLQAQDVWFAIYDNIIDSVVYPDRLGDDFSNLQSGRAEGEANVAVGSENDAMITWVVKDAAAQSSDIWFTHLTETDSAWVTTEPDVIDDLPGTNFDVNVAYVDSALALAVWINDPDGDEETYDNVMIFSEWDGNTWSNAQLLADNDGYTIYKDVALSSNNGYIAVAYISTYYYSDNDFENRIETEIYDAVTGDWDDNSYFEDWDSLYYFQSMQVSISDIGIASICYQAIDMFPDTTFIDNGTLYLFVKDLNNTAPDWTEITNSTVLADTSTYVWELTTGFSADNRYYTMTQEYNDNGVVTNPHNGILFGEQNLSMVLRGLQVNSDLTVSDISEPGTVPNGIKDLAYRPNFNLLQNYPNPFNEFTTIEFHLQQSSNVSLEIYNLTGGKVAQLVNSRLNPGIYKTVFDAGDLPAGFYISRLTVDGITSSGKLVLTKNK